ncbi:3-oxoacyl-ACP synthase [Algoriphagus sp.]|uniref:3-oxoacyl-ACP synthase n=1 Tax=Algoriphagus sp. TaxID=1872435 RepID=UPI003F7134FD
MAVNIITSCIIENGSVTVNGSELFSSGSSDSAMFLKETFKELQLSYPKFYKMDKLCQLAFVGTEFLLKAVEEEFGDDEVALCFFCGQSSLDTDFRHQQLINEGANVSPAIFVYTLPNIMMGEIAIRNKWYGENLLILKPEFDFESWAIEAEVLIASGKANYCLGGWVDVFQENYKLQLYLAEATGSRM